MLFVDHIAAGIVLPSLFESFQNTPAITVSVISSALPDITAVSGLKGDIRYLSHRGPTHTLLFAPFLSIMPVVLVYLILGSQIKNTLIELYVLSLLSYVIHIAMDALTPFGTKVLYPLSTKKLSFDLFPTLEPVTDGISTIFIIFFLFQITLCQKHRIFLIC